VRRRGWNGRYKDRREVTDVFGDSGPGESPARYSFELISGHLREKSHKSDVQKALNEGSNRGWELVNASHGLSSGGYTTALFWDTSPRSH